MRKERIAKFITVAIMLAAFGAIAIRKTGARLPQAKEDSPQDCVYGMLEAARKGDTSAYLARYTGPMEASLKQTISEKTDPAFRNYIRSSNAEIKGVAVAEPKSVSGEEAEVRVEYVYADRNEAQTMYLEKKPGGWKIARVESAERVKTLVPYGTPVQ